MSAALVLKAPAIPPVPISMQAFKRLPKEVQRLGKAAAEQDLGIHVFHEQLHEDDIPHWIARRKEGFFLIWGENAENSFKFPDNSSLIRQPSMARLRLGSRVEG